MVWRVVQQVDDFASGIGELYQALEKLRAHTAAFRAIVHFELEVRQRRLLWLKEEPATSPPGYPR